MQYLLQLIDMRADPLQSSGVIGQRQQVIQKVPAMAGPSQMLGEQLRLIAIQQGCQALQVGLVERLLPANGEPDAMNRQGIQLADPGQVVVKRPPIDHVVFGMDFKKAHGGPSLQDLDKMFRLEPYPGTKGHGPSVLERGSSTEQLMLRHGIHGRLPSRMAAQLYLAWKASNCPMPVGDVGDAVCTQVPAGTIFQASP